MTAKWFAGALLIVGCLGLLVAKVVSQPMPKVEQPPTQISTSPNPVPSAATSGVPIPPASTVEAPTQPAVNPPLSGSATLERANLAPATGTIANGSNTPLPQYNPQGIPSATQAPPQQGAPKGLAFEQLTQALDQVRAAQTAEKQRHEKAEQTLREKEIALLVAMWKHIELTKKETQKEEAIFRKVQGDNELRFQEGDRTVNVPPLPKKGNNKP